MIILHTGLYLSMYGHVMVRTTKKRSTMSPDPFLACMMGSGNETSLGLVVEENPTIFIVHYYVCGKQSCDTMYMQSLKAIWGALVDS